MLKWSSTVELGLRDRSYAEINKSLQSYHYSSLSSNNFYSGSTCHLYVFQQCSFCQRDAKSLALKMDKGAMSQRI